VGDKGRGDCDPTGGSSAVLLSLDHRAHRLPSEARVPELSSLWSTVGEALKLNVLPGSIYLWIERLERTTCLPALPRAFGSYSRELADRIGHAKSGIDQARIISARRAISEMPEGEPDEDRRLARTPRRQDDPFAPETRCFILHMPSIEFETCGAHCRRAAASKDAGACSIQVSIMCPNSFQNMIMSY